MGCPLQTLGAEPGPWLTPGSPHRFASQLLMTNCPEVSELRRLLDGDSSAEDVGELVRHVDGCPTCLQRLDEFTRQNALPLAARAAAVCRTPESDE